mmetsp:Transcript_18285/g.43199  ORF Transcript_18285/g.43199 Transcript_18285/m.43199 type:complete len:223 (+) Transcript_18285:1751-2419(+)
MVGVEGTAPAEAPSNDRRPRRRALNPPLHRHRRLPPPHHRLHRRPILLLRRHLPIKDKHRHHDEEDLRGPRALMTIWIMYHGAPSPNGHRPNAEIRPTRTLPTTETKQVRQKHPKKRTISLLPHRTETLYQEQRKDSVLRKFISNGTAPNMTVHNVHGRNLVFFSDKVYIPGSLREQSLTYYHKKHAYNPMHAIKKNCFWPDLEQDVRTFGKKGKNRWRVEE